MEQQAKAPQDLRNVVNYLRSSKAGMKIRVGVLNGKRIDYFKGMSAVATSFVRSMLLQFARTCCSAARVEGHWAGPR